MKNILFVVLGVFISGAAMAGVKITETDTVTIVEQFYVAPHMPNAVSRPCAKRADEPVRVKTHTEIIDHYQVYQPVTVYKPMGTQIQRRVVPAKSCGKCGV